MAAGNGSRVMAYGVPSSRPWSAGEDPFFVSLRGDATEDIPALWKKLSEGATVAAPLAAPQWAPLYGMLKDRSGITCVVDIAVKYNAS